MLGGEHFHKEDHAMKALVYEGRGLKSWKEVSVADILPTSYEGGVLMGIGHPIPFMDEAVTEPPAGEH
jgi:hypothetical protein